jgi:aminoglycoside 3-N-acetyltransferase I
LSPIANFTATSVNSKVYSQSPANLFLCGALSGTFADTFLNVSVNAEGPVNLKRTTKFYMDIQVKKLNPKDIDKFTDLIRVFEEVFEMKNFAIPEEKHLIQLLAKEDFFVFVAVLDSKVVGGLTTYILQQYYSVSPLVFIYDVAIKTEVKRQGVGKLLISNLSGYCKDNGYEEMFVLADEADNHAIEFYRSTGATEGRVVNFNYTLNNKQNSEKWHPSHAGSLLPAMKPGSTRPAT